MDLHEQKKKLRKEIKERSAGISREYRASASEKITDLIVDTPEYKYAEMIFCFAGEGAEPDTSALIEKALADGKRVCMPLCITDSLMEAREITDPAKDLTEGAYGILEPSENLTTVPSDAIDLGIIPCVTCDHSGNRLGHGKGYYDRFLADEDMALVMICLEEITVEEGRIPMGELDLPIEVVITEAGICRN